MAPMKGAQPLAIAPGSVLWGVDEVSLVYGGLAGLSSLGKCDSWLVDGSGAPVVLAISMDLLVVSSVDDDGTGGGPLVYRNGLVRSFGAGPREQLKWTVDPLSYNSRRHSS